MNACHDVHCTKAAICSSREIRCDGIIRCIRSGCYQCACLRVFVIVWLKEARSNVQQDSMHGVEQDAYQRGLSVKQRHMEIHCVLDAEATLLLAGDFAHLFLYQELHCAEVSDPHARAALRIRAFQQGYQQRSPQEQGRNVVPELSPSLCEVPKPGRRHPRSKRRKRETLLPT